MKVVRASAMLLCLVLLLGGAVLGSAQEKRGMPVIDHKGTIKSIKIDKPGLQPGTGAATLVLSKYGEGEVTFVVRPGTWIANGSRFLTLRDLEVGDHIEVRAIEASGAVAGPIVLRAMGIEASGGSDEGDENKD